MRVSMMVLTSEPGGQVVLTANPLRAAGVQKRLHMALTNISGVMI
jgi:hypothetical protein